jgi:hypothetical protein
MSVERWFQRSRCLHWVPYEVLQPLLNCPNLLIGAARAVVPTGFEPLVTYAHRRMRLEAGWAGSPWAFRRGRCRTRSFVCSVTLRQCLECARWVTFGEAFPLIATAS